MKIIWTRHAEQRQKEWELKKGITRKEVELVVRNPDQIVQGDLNVIVAQSKRGDGLLRIPCVSTLAGRKVLTVYWTSKIEKYWEEAE
jgi:hypothetical protein